MRYQHVCVEAVACTLPSEVVTTDEIENQLASVYQRLGLPAGRIELMTGIRERRFFPRAVKIGEESARTGRAALEMARFDPAQIGALVHGSVCRDQLEPATANLTHHLLALPSSAFVTDVSNACLGLLNGMVLVANMIELGQIKAGLVVGTEDGRPLVEGTIEALLANPNLTRRDMKQEFASLTIGSGSAAILLCDRRLSRTGNRLLGGAVACDTSSHELCAGGDNANPSTDGRPRMQTDSEALLHAGVQLAERAWGETRRNLDWQNDEVDRVFTHQVGRAHRRLMLDRLGLPADRDFPTVEFLGNTGAAALPTAWSLGIQAGALTPGHRVALLGIGSGLNSMMLGVEWQAGTA